MHKIQELFDPTKQLNRNIESVVTFGAKTVDDLKAEVREYVVTDKLHDNYEDVLEDFQQAFDNGSKEVGVWVSGFYGSGKSSFAKYLGLSFDKSLMIDGVTFGERLMNRINDTRITQMHRTIINRNNPEVVMIDLSTQSTAGKTSMVSDIVYFETLKLLGITKCSDQKVMFFIDLLHAEGKYDEFCRLVEEEKRKRWQDVESNDLIANLFAAEFAPRLLPAYFSDSDSYNNINLNSALNEKDRFTRLYNLVKQKTGKENIIFVLDEVGQYVASNVSLILNVQGMMQIFKDEFRGKVWVIATAQQTLTEDNQQAQLNSNELFRLNDRFPIKVDIEANDIKEIITKRLLGKSKEGKDYLVKQFQQNEGVLKLNTHLTLQERSIYNQLLTEESFANLYPFLPVHIDILLSLLQKLASRTGGVGLRSVIRLIRDILVDNHLADATIGQMAGPEHFYDILHNDMEKNAAKEIVYAADKAVRMYTGNELAVRICKTIAVMQLLDDFNLSFDNVCALLNNQVDGKLDKARVRELIDEISQQEGLTLQEVEGKYQFMTNAILGIREERSKIVPKDAEKAEVMQHLLKDMLSPQPTVNVYSSLTFGVGVELSERNKLYSIYPTSSLKMNVRFVSGTQFPDVHKQLLIESSRPENNNTLYWLCTLSKDKEELLQEIVKSQTIRNRHQNETNKEIQTYLRAQSDLADEKQQQLLRILREAQANSEVIFRGSPQQVNAETVKTVAMKGIAEKIYDKYPMASASMKSDCVSKLAAYADLATLPDSLNPLKIVNKTDGSINTTHDAVVEIKDYIASKGELAGSELARHFEAMPYGWSKDTLRYITALMLKAGIILIRVAGKSVTVFGDIAATAMGNNNSFAKVSIEINTEGTLSPAELLAAARQITTIFGSGKRIAPVKDQIAKEAFSKVKMNIGKFTALQKDFELLHLAGLPTLNRAIDYANRIIESEGGDAAYLLSKDNECPKALKYAMDMLQCAAQSGLIDHIKHMHKLINDAATLPPLGQLADFRKKVDNVQQMYNGYIGTAELNEIASEVSDLRATLDSYLREACIEFETQSNSQLTQTAEEILADAQNRQLSESQISEITASLGQLSVDKHGASLENLRDMVNQYTAYYMPMGQVSGIKQRVNQLVSANKPAVTVTTTTTSTPATGDDDHTGDGTGTTTVQEPETNPTRVSVKHRITSRAELQQVIDQLIQLLDTVDDNSPVEFNF